MNNTDFSQLSQFVAYAQKRFELPLLAGCFADARPQPEIPSRAVGLSLVLGEVVHTREVTCKDAQGLEFKKTRYYHKQVYAQLSGPELSVILDVERDGRQVEVWDMTARSYGTWVICVGRSRITPLAN